jgi:protein required for attachment to host cells
MENKNSKKEKQQGSKNRDPKMNPDKIQKEKDSFIQENRNKEKSKKILSISQSFINFFGGFFFSYFPTNYSPFAYHY